MTAEQTPTEAPQAAAAPAAAPAAKRSTAKRSTAKSGTAKRSTAKSGTAKRSTAKRSTGQPAAKKASTPRSKFPEYKTEAAAEKVMKANEAGYKQYQVERDKNRNEKGMEKHRLAYKTYKNAYTQLLNHRKARGATRRNAKAS